MSRETKVARVSSREYQRGENCAEREPQRFSESPFNDFYRILMSVLM